MPPPNSTPPEEDPIISEGIRQMREIQESLRRPESERESEPFPSFELRPQNTNAGFPAEEPLETLTSLTYSSLISGDNREVDRLRQRYLEEVAGLKRYPGPKLTLNPEIEARLSKAQIILRKREKDRLVEKVYPGGDKESDWQNHIKSKQKKVMPIWEITESEIPILVDHVQDRLEESLHHGHRDIGADKEGLITITCAECALVVPPWYAWFCYGRLYCAEHVPTFNLCGVCGELKKDTLLVKTFDKQELFLCERCDISRTHCNCGNSLEKIYKFVGMCKSCVNSPARFTGTRAFSHGLKWTGSQPGKTMTSGRFFSAELEALSPTRDWANILYRTLPGEMGIATDGSVEGFKLYGFEVQTPRLSGAKGEELIAHVTSAMSGVDATVNQSCGMHIHLDGAGLLPKDRGRYPVELMQLWKAYILYEGVLMSFLPFSRRRNDYCRPLSEAFQLNELDMVDSLVEAEKLWYKERTYQEVRHAKRQHYHTSRYFGINLNPLFGKGHMEIRSHSGTLNPQKILEWANLHALILDAAQAREFGSDFLNETQATPGLREKTRMLFEQIGLPESSRQYFYGRQKKFGDKKARDEEVSDNRRIPPVFENPFDGPFISNGWA